MITHEEARNLVNELVPTDAITPSQIDDLHIYITQQELKEQRAKKVEELLRMYQENSVIVTGDITIKMLEKELEEMK
jgi:CRISPR/Cas system CMR subunit Cmr4 (Cas7 group RAMP superfamily)